MSPYRLKKRFKKKRKSIFKRKGFWWSLTGFILAGLLVYFLLFSSIFKIKVIELTGDKWDTAEEYILNEQDGTGPMSDFDLKGKNLFLVKAKTIEKEILDSFPELKKAEVQKKLPDKLIILVQKRITVGLGCFSEQSCFFIDKEGIMFQRAQNAAPGDWPVIFPPSELEDETLTLGSNVIPEEKMEQILKIDRELKKLKIATAKFILSENNRLDVKTVLGWEIYFELNDNIDLSLTKLKLLLEKEISPEARKGLEYIDLRFSKVYYR